jgi:hypothetical protein
MCQALFRLQMRSKLVYQKMNVLTKKFPIKGIVRREKSGVENGTIRTVMISHKIADVFSYT